MPNANEPRFPTHVAIIVDGNRRWAKQRMLPVSVGHKAGFDRLREITRYAVGDRGVFVLSLYVFSTENFSRDAKEVGYLMDLFANNFRTIADEMNERGCKVLFSGRREGLQQRVLDAMDYMMDLTKDNEKGIVNFCLNYGSHAELTDATRAIAAEVKAGTLEPEAIDEKVIEKHLYRDLPPVDLMIRRSGCPTSCCGSAPTRSSTLPIPFSPILPRSALIRHWPSMPAATDVWAGIRRSDPLKMPSPLGEGGRGSARGRMRGEPAAAARQRVAPGNFALISHLR